MPNTYFQFKHFLVNQDRCAMKVGTDSVLLGAWAPLLGNEKRIADLGTGTGILALIMAQRSNARVIAYESEADAASQASENFSVSPWSSRLECRCIRIQEVQEDSFDLCIFNPPYFNRQLQSPNPVRNQVRHMNNQLPGEWMDACKRLLHRTGRICMIIPVQEENVWLEAALTEGFVLNRKILVSGQPDKTPLRVLLEFARQENETMYGTLVIQSRQRGVYTSDFKEITSSVYPDSYWKT